MASLSSSGAITAIAFAAPPPPRPLKGSPKASEAASEVRSAVYVCESGDGQHSRVVTLHRALDRMARKTRTEASRPPRVPPPSCSPRSAGSKLRASPSQPSPPLSSFTARAASLGVSSLGVSSLGFSRARRSTPSARCASASASAPEAMSPLLRPGPLARAPTRALQSASCGLSLAARRAKHSAASSGPASLERPKLPRNTESKGADRGVSLKCALTRAQRRGTDTQAFGGVPEFADGRSKSPSLARAEKVNPSGSRRCGAKRMRR
mmetsp:Transcript_29187/g.65358  ORF Transcript_29187/g.65358 Transcript_29187/m.65358 type:complete len:266 (+) Transcript_29187:646-1443(+)